MAIKADSWIRKMAEEQKMIEPFAEKQARAGISFGVGSYGYDFRIGNTFKIFDTSKDTTLDPKNFDKMTYTDFVGEVCEIPPHSFVLATTIEYFRIPRNILTICTGKSTYARCGIMINVTPFEPEWEGYATISISNTNSVPARIYAGEGIGQLIFLQSDETCEISYADKKGKYQGQKEITLAKGSG
tara:strand:+ start:297 stop:854 length:558 start_codon:yes stop_codon:yes gene_type:complete